MQTQKTTKNVTFGHHRITLSGYIFATKARIDNRKNLLNSNVSPTCPRNMVYFGLLAAEICWRVWAAQHILTGFASWQRYCTALKYSSGHQPNFAALNRGRHLYSAGRPSHSSLFGSRPSDHYFRSVCLSVCAEFFFQPSSIRFGSN